MAQRDARLPPPSRVVAGRLTITSNLSGIRTAPCLARGPNFREAHPYHSPLKAISSTNRRSGSGNTERCRSGDNETGMP